jgi:dihydrofolate reductase
MGKLIYAAIASLDGYIEDRTGKFDWAFPGDQVHQFANDLQRPIGTHLYGRRLYETMMGWETDPHFAAGSPIAKDFADVWKAAEKIVYSKTLPAVSTTRTRLERSFDPAAIRDLKARAQRDLLIGGANLAAHAFQAGLVDEVHLTVVPAVVGGGKRCLPSDVRLKLHLLDERRFDNGMVYLRYRVDSLSSQVSTTD